MSDLDKDIDLIERYYMNALDKRQQSFSFSKSILSSKYPIKEVLDYWKKEYQHQATFGISEYEIEITISEHEYRSSI
ncbi:MAG: hypothetical protein LBV67_11710 [Streptococcaceae bacterium]|nr:hypothetical protein [Streptococcaceae bacterium]